MINIKAKQEEFDDRKQYLVAMVIAYLRENAEDTIFYDDAECDGYCLAEDLEIEFNLGE